MMKNFLIFMVKWMLSLIAAIEIPLLGSMDPNQIGLLIFFLGGLATAISPCLFPILPLTLLRLFGAESRKKALILTTILLSGVILAFMIYAILADYLFDVLGQTFTELNAIMGVILIFIGLYLILEHYIPVLKSVTGKLPGLQPRMDEDKDSYIDVFILGMGYSLIAIPCASGIYMGLIGLIQSGDPLYSFFGFPLFAVGLALPYYILAISASEFRMQIAQWMARKSKLVNIIMGALLVIIGLSMSLPYFGFFDGEYWWIVIDEDTLALFIIGILAVLSLLALVFFIYKKWIKKAEIAD